MILFFFFNDTATTEIYTLSLHDALPISDPGEVGHVALPGGEVVAFEFIDMSMTTGSCHYSN